MDLAHEADAAAAATAGATGRGSVSTQAQRSGTTGKSERDWEVHFPITHATHEQSQGVRGQGAG